MREFPEQSLQVTFSLSKDGKKVATIRILSKRSVMWRRVSVDKRASRKELYDMAVRMGKKHCKGPVARRLCLPV